MKQSSQRKISVCGDKFIYVLVVCAVLTIVSLVTAKDDTHPFSFNGMNSISGMSGLNGINGSNPKSDSMFYNDEPRGDRKGPRVFDAELGHKLSDGIKVTATGSQYAVKMIPITLSQSTGTREGNRITYVLSPGVKIIYTFKGNGVKEDIVFDNPATAPDELAFQLELDKMLEARLDKKGNILIYGPNSILSGFIQTGDEKSVELVMKARRNAAKDNLLYIIPAPVIIDGEGATHKGIAYYELDKSIITLHTGAIMKLPAPVSIDPSIVVTTTADFLKGNNEGMISFDTDAISRALPAGGTVGTWSATNSFTTGRYGHTTVSYNGNLYIIGGRSSSGVISNVQFASFLVDGTISGWTSTTSLTTARTGHTSVAYNGYLYVIGGSSGTTTLNDVQYAPINTNGTIGSWTATTSFATARYGHSSVAYNGYLYVIGGYNGLNFSDVQYAPINANGSIGTWSMTTSMPEGLYNHTSVAYNGYLYVMGGSTAFYYINTVQMARINSNGSIGSWRTTSPFTNARGGASSAVYNGYLYIMGGYDSISFLNDAQFAVINPDGTIGIWTATSSIATGRYLHTSAVYNGYLYILGGTDMSTDYNDVQYAPITAWHPKGTVGSWAATTGFTGERWIHSTVAYNGYLYVIGGSLGGVLTTDVQYAPINANGTVGTWTATTSFTTGRCGHTSVVYNGYIYIIGGRTSVPTYLNDVQYALINADGTVGTWTATTTFTTGRYAHSSVAYNGFLYVIGGYNGSNLSDVQFALINTNGTIGTWTATTSLPTGRWRHASVANNGYLYVIGGSSIANMNLDDVQYAHANADGTVGNWTATTSFPLGRDQHTAVVYNGYLYILGGSGVASPFQNDVQYVSFNSDGTLGTWAATTSFTTGRYGHTSVAYNGYLYVLGGFGNDYLADVQCAPINNSSGTISTWRVTTSFPTARYIHTSVAYNGYLYVLGGSSGSGSFLNDVQYAAIFSDGTIGSWTSTNSFTTARYGHASVAHNGYLYIIGGYNGTHLNDVQYAPINANGTVSTWVFTTSFTTGRRLLRSVVYNNYMYVIGGYNGSYFNDVQYAPVNTDGTVGAWLSTTNFNVARYGHSAIAYNGYLYIIGGYSGVYLFDVQYALINANGTIGVWNYTTSFDPRHFAHTSVEHNGYLYIIGGSNVAGAYLNDVQFAPLFSNGTVGSWNITNGFTTGRQGHTSVENNGFLYVIGGYNGTRMTDVLVATFAGYPALRGYYSKLIDIGSEQCIDSINYSGNVTNGITNLTYAVAPASTAVFGTRTTILDATSGTQYTTGLGTFARYAWARFELDDTGLSEEEARRDVLDFTINYSSFSSSVTSLLVSKSPPNVHLAWSTTSCATSYHVLRCSATAGSCTPVTIGTSLTNSYNDPVLGDTNNYWYLIEAY